MEARWQRRKFAYENFSFSRFRVFQAARRAFLFFFFLFERGLKSVRGACLPLIIANCFN